MRRIWLLSFPPSFFYYRCQVHTGLFRQAPPTLPLACHCTPASQVNQCVGRVVRHKGDYAAIILADCRYAAGGGGSGGGGGSSSSSSRGAPVSKLPQWLQASLSLQGTHFGHVYSRLVAFFRAQAPVLKP